MKGKKKSLGLIVLLLLVGLTSGYVASTYAKYTTTITGNEGTAIVAAWNFQTDNASQTIEIDVAGTVDPTTLINDRIAPGTSGSFNVVLNNTSEVGVDFVVALQTIDHKPTNLKFYRDAAHTTEITPGTTQITGQLIAFDTDADPAAAAVQLTVPIYWEWAYETAAIATNDPIDTANGEATLANRTLTIGVNITGTQVRPGAAITTHVN